MAETPKSLSPSTNSMPYVWAGLIFFLLGGLFILALLFLRPGLDPLILISSVAGIMGTMFTGVAAYLKSQETHLTVNNQLTTWKAEFFEMAHSKGLLEGTEQEQARVAEQLRVKNLTVPRVTPTATPVIVENPNPVPVTDKGRP